MSHNPAGVGYPEQGGLKDGSKAGLKMTFDYVGFDGDYQYGIVADNVVRSGCYVGDDDAAAARSRRNDVEEEEEQEE